MKARDVFNYIKRDTYFIVLKYIAQRARKCHIHALFFLALSSAIMA